jgi:hypothetical protein
MANKKDLNLYKQNSFSSGTEVSLADLEVYNAQNPSNTTIPYIIFKTKSSPDVLPFNKANEDINCDITFVNPALDHALEMGEVTAE